MENKPGTEFKQVWPNTMAIARQVRAVSVVCSPGGSSTLTRHFKKEVLQYPSQHPHARACRRTRTHMHTRAHASLGYSPCPAPTSFRPDLSPLDVSSTHGPSLLLQFFVNATGVHSLERTNNRRAPEPHSANVPHSAHPQYLLKQQFLNGWLRQRASAGSVHEDGGNTFSHSHRSCVCRGASRERERTWRKRKGEKGGRGGGPTQDEGAYLHRDLPCKPLRQFLLYDTRKPLKVSCI